MIPSFFVRDRDRIAVTHVCHHWRDTFLSTPALWDVVTTSDNPDRTVAYLERSGDVPLKVVIATCGPEPTGWKTSFRVLGQHSHRFRTMRLHKDRNSGEDIFAIMGNPFPHLTELEITIPDVEPVARREDHPLFPSLKSLILRGDMGYLEWFQLTNLRKLGVDCFGWGFCPSVLLGLLTKAPLLEELELKVDQNVLNSEFVGDLPPVVLKHLRRIVFQGTLPPFLRSLISHITPTIPKSSSHATSSATADTPFRPNSRRKRISRSSRLQGIFGIGSFTTRITRRRGLAST